jgi:uncharacterized protein (DUF302 family)
MENCKFAAVQNGVILELFDTKDAAIERVHAEIKRDWLSIMTRKKLRKLLKKKDNVSLHCYHVLQIVNIEEVNV